MVVHSGSSTKLVLYLCNTDRMKPHTTTGILLDPSPRTACLLHPLSVDIPLMVAQPELHQTCCSAPSYQKSEDPF